MNKILKIWKEHLEQDKLSNIKHNVRSLEKVWINIETPPDDSILSQIRIGNFIGEGCCGKIFEIEGQDRVIKLSTSEQEHDVKRYYKIMDQMFSGTASIEDMHYFDYGKIHGADYYYLIMPKIIPIENALFYEKEPLFEFLIDFSGAIARRYEDLDIPSYQVFRLHVENRLIGRYGEGTVGVFLENYEETIEKILRAAYRAFSLLDGVDLHSGNIGYLPQNPSIFFFYDM